MKKKGSLDEGPHLMLSCFLATLWPGWQCCIMGNGGREVCVGVGVLHTQASFGHSVYDVWASPSI